MPDLNELLASRSNSNAAVTRRDALQKQRQARFDAIEAHLPQEECALEKDFTKQSRRLLAEDERAWHPRRLLIELGCEAWSCHISILEPCRIQLVLGCLSEVKRARHPRRVLIAKEPCPFKPPIPNSHYRADSQSLRSASKSFANSSIGICFHDATYSHVHSRNANEQSTNERCDGETRLERLLPPRRHSSVCCHSALGVGRAVVGYVVKPKGAGYTIGVPGRKLHI